MATFVVEDGSGLATANSYCSVAEADTYHSNNGNPAAWVDNAATGILAMYNQPTDGQTITVDGNTYTFKNTLAATKQIKIGATLAGTVANLAAALNDNGQSGVQYNMPTGGDTTVTAAVSDTNVVLTARTGGVAGNSVATTATLTAPNRFMAATLSGGYASKEEALRIATATLDRMYGGRWLERRTSLTQALDWPRTYVDDSDGFRVASDVVPNEIKAATSILALASLIGEDLMPDQSASDRSVHSQAIKVGPIEKSTTYGTTGKSSQKKYRKVEGMLIQFLTPGTRIFRA